MTTSTDAHTEEKDLTVLIVEDEFVTRTVLSALLVGSGFETRSCDSAESALKVLDDSPAPEIALVDLDLPGMNGAEFISELGRKRPGIFPVLITAASNERVSRILDPKVAHLRKPVDYKELLHVIDARPHST